MVYLVLIYALIYTLGEFVSRRIGLPHSVTFAGLAVFLAAALILYRRRYGLGACRRGRKRWPGLLLLLLWPAGDLVLAACGRSEETAASAQPTAAADKAGNITLCPTYDDGKGGYFSVTLPASWGDDYLTECGANDGGYYVGFYEKTDYNNGLGGFLFMLEVFPTDYDYTVLPEYQAICGLTVDGANYNLIAELPTDVQFANENADLYRSMSNDFSAILKSLTFSKGVTRTEVTAPTQTSDSGS